MGLAPVFAAPVRPSDTQPGHASTIVAWGVCCPASVRGAWSPSGGGRGAVARSAVPSWGRVQWKV